ncbi:TIMP metallopeptidase inhibitor 4, tandem duplicate 2 precursor [Danio rerio]|uniref:Metalloproteinase inhibitor 4 n=1 Tax=Danio rerio TaxID=7955 RepID=A0A8M1P9Q2_DANRE|nr:TIMP metallopeptidase inhibitor 4, tandem duplicate 2 precursor [Danio rerio]|eukprot:NP_001315189.1 si:ch73-206h6.3 precursor [Danio rerio]
MMKMKMYVSAGLLFFMCVCLNEQMLEACSCIPFHPQQEFCYSSAVIKAMVLDEEPIPGQDPEEIKYKINVLQVFKGAEHAGIEYLHTASDGAMCGIRLRPGIYLLAVRGVHVGLCDLVVRWDNLSKTHKKILSLGQEACDCKVSHCFKEPCDENKCYLTDMFDSVKLYSESICMANSTGSCRWINAY